MSLPFAAHVASPLGWLHSLPVGSADIPYSWHLQHSGLFIAAETSPAQIHTLPFWGLPTGTPGLPAGTLTLPHTAWFPGFPL
jgi:hypothetical protein